MRNMEVSLSLTLAVPFMQSQMHGFIKSSNPVYDLCCLS